MTVDNLIGRCKQYVEQYVSKKAASRLDDAYKESRFDENDLVCEIPLIQPKNKMLDIDKIVEAWKWSEFGDLLRKTMVF